MIWETYKSNPPDNIKGLSFAYTTTTPYICEFIISYDLLFKKYTMYSLYSNVIVRSAIIWKEYISCDLEN